MSALGQKQTSTHVRAMSALPPIADILGARPKIPSRGWRETPSQICTEFLKVYSATADYVRFTPKSGHWNPVVT